MLYGGSLAAAAQTLWFKALRRYATAGCNIFITWCLLAGWIIRMLVFCGRTSFVKVQRICDNVQDTIEGFPDLCFDVALFIAEWCYRSCQKRRCSWRDDPNIAIRQYDDQQYLRIKQQREEQTKRDGKAMRDILKNRDRRRSCASDERGGPDESPGPETTVPSLSPRYQAFKPVALSAKMRKIIKAGGH